MGLLCQEVCFGGDGRRQMEDVACTLASPPSNCPQTGYHPSLADGMWPLLVWSSNHLAIYYAVLGVKPRFLMYCVNVLLESQPSLALF